MVAVLTGYSGVVCVAPDVRLLGNARNSFFYSVFTFFGGIEKHGKLGPQNMEVRTPTSSADPLCATAGPLQRKVGSWLSCYSSKLLREAETITFGS